MIRDSIRFRDKSRMDTGKPIWCSIFEDSDELFAKIEYRIRPFVGQSNVQGGLLRLIGARGRGQTDAERDGQGVLVCPVRFHRGTELSLDQSGRRQRRMVSRIKRWLCSGPLERAVNGERVRTAFQCAINEQPRRQHRPRKRILIAAHVARVQPPEGLVLSGAVAALDRNAPLFQFKPEEVVAVIEDADGHVRKQLKRLGDADFLPKGPIHRLEVLAWVLQLRDGLIIGLELAIEEAPRLPLGFGQHVVVGVFNPAPARLTLGIEAANAQITGPGQTTHIDVDSSFHAVGAYIATRNRLLQSIKFR